MAVVGPREQLQQRRSERKQAEEVGGDAQMQQVISDLRELRSEQAMLAADVRSMVSRGDRSRPPQSEGVRVAMSERVATVKKSLDCTMSSFEDVVRLLQKFAPGGPSAVGGDVVPVTQEDISSLIASVGAAMRAVGTTWEHVSALCSAKTARLEADDDEPQRMTVAQTTQEWRDERPPSWRGLEPAIDPMKQMREMWARGAREEFRSMKTIIFDCDGVLWNVQDPEKLAIPNQLQTNIIAKVNEFIRDREKRVIFLTNNSHKTREGFIKQLSGINIDFGDISDPEVLKRYSENMITAGYTTAKLLKQMEVKKPFVLTSTPGILHEMDALGLDYISTYDTSTSAQFAKYMQPFDKAAIEGLMDEHKDVDAVVMGWDFNLTTLKIGLAANILRWGMDDASVTKKPIPLITCSSDSSGVMGVAQDGRKIRAVGNGAMGDSVAGCFDPKLHQEFCGKPSDKLLKLLRDPEAKGGYGVDFSTAVMVGDTIETDIEFANRGGMRSLFVLTGVNSLEDMMKTPCRNRWATYILPSFADV